MATIVTDSALAAILDAAAPLTQGAPAPDVPLACNRLDCIRCEDGICQVYWDADFEGADTTDCTDYRRDDGKCDCGQEKFKTRWGTRECRRCG
jgi:hypothetical protein